MLADQDHKGNLVYLVMMGNLATQVNVVIQGIKAILEEMDSLDVMELQEQQVLLDHVVI